MLRSLLSLPVVSIFVILTSSFAEARVFLPSIYAHSPQIQLKATPTKRKLSSVQHDIFKIPRGGNSITSSSPLNGVRQVSRKDESNPEVSKISRGGKVQINKDNFGWWISFAINIFYLVFFAIPQKTECSVRQIGFCVTNYDSGSCPPTKTHTFGHLEKISFFQFWRSFMAQ